ncbi:MAG: hypothetical protein V6003_01000 [Candidatus Dasytiphilus stammeri]
MSYEKIVTLFDSIEHAKTANQNLLKSGFYNEDISIIHSEQLKAENLIFKEHDIWQRLLGNSLTEQEAKIYAQAIDTGGILLILRTHNEKETSRAMEILNAYQFDNLEITTLSQKCRYPRNDNSHHIFDKDSINKDATRVRRFVIEKHQHLEFDVPLHEEHVAILRRAFNNNKNNMDWSETREEINTKPPVIDKKTS